MADEYPHIFIKDSFTSKVFTTPSGGGRGEIDGPPRNRQAHSQKLHKQWAAIWEKAEELETGRLVVAMPAKDGMCVEFEGAAGYGLITKSLEDVRAGIRLLNVYLVPSEEDPVKQITRATVFIPSGKQSVFLKKLTEYACEETKKNKPKNAKLVESIESVRMAVLESFWQDDLGLLPQGVDAAWCEFWLQGTESPVAARFRQTATALDMEIQTGALFFPERTVVLGRATLAQLTLLVEHSSDIAELRRAKETAGFFLELENKDQTDWVNDLVSRLEVNPRARVAVCVLDSGANNGHELLAPLLSDRACQAVDPDWGSYDHHPHGHGTMMCGVAGYGDLLTLLQSYHVVKIEHCLESVKILPPAGENDPLLYGFITLQGMSLAAIQAPARSRIGCLAVTASGGRDAGRPTSWSAAIDQFTSGFEDDNQTLFIVSAGNCIDQLNWSNYPFSNFTFSVEDPGQSWNAITVGAYTEKAFLADPLFKDHEPLAKPGELSPFSSTSLTWDSKWPNKPELLFEGGNLVKGPDGFVGDCADLSLLSTGHQPTKWQFNPFCATSAAAPQAAWMAAQIQARYPDAWPETIRGLMIHNASWPSALMDQFFSIEGRGKITKTDYGRLLRVAGYGVPNLSRSLACAANSLTLISEAEIQPFAKQDYDYKTNKMHLHKLPWPKDVLLDLGEAEVTLRITLSYFIEPGPGEVGWKDRYRYASHGLRFDLNSSMENETQFMKRLNKAARTEGEKIKSTSDSERWLIGSNCRDRGSVHSDIWKGMAAEIATCNLIGIVPVIGWWRERPFLGRFDRKARYSLIVSLQTQKEDIYTPIAIELGIPPVPIEI